MAASGLEYGLDLPHGRVRNVQDPIQESYRPHVRLAENERDGLASCPTAINCQLSLLCYERARELEHDILVGLRMLLVEPNAKKNSSETLFVTYTVLTVLMDAYESYAISFQVWLCHVQWGPGIPLADSCPNLNSIARQTAGLPRKRCRVFQLCRKAAEKHLG